MPTTQSMQPLLPRAVRMLRIVIAVTMMTHGIARLWLGTVPGFGEFLSSKGFPAGTAIAWVVTIMDIIGGAALAAGFFVPVLCTWFVCVLANGIVLVHARNGWFVVGASTGGVEYSIVLIAALIAVACGAIDSGQKSSS